MSKKLMTLLLLVIAIIIVIGLAIGPIPQHQAYHNFADRRSYFGTPNTWNVLSNITFALAGIWGVFLLCTERVQFLDNRERWPWLGVALGLILTAIGSTYYHLDPDNFRLMFDRLPMTLVFMSLIGALITERVNILLGLCLWPALLLFGFYTVIYWYATEQQGAGDLRLYLGVQVYAVAVTLIMAFMPSPYNRTWDLAAVVLLFGLAHIFEMFDGQIVKFTDGAISGHTLKHFVAALAGAWLLFMVWQRKIRRRC